MPHHCHRNIYSDWDPGPAIITGYWTLGGQTDISDTH